MKTKTKSLKVRVTAEEYQTLADLARDERSVSDLIRKQIFGRQGDAIRYLARIHANLLHIARSLSQQENRLQLAQALAYIVAIEREVGELLNCTNRADWIL